MFRTLSLFESMKLRSVLFSMALCTNLVSPLPLFDGCELYVRERLAAPAEPDDETDSALLPEYTGGY
jgi:hypothetical protein